MCYIWSSGSAFSMGYAQTYVSHFVHRFSINATQHLCVYDLDYEVELVVNVTILAKDNGGVPPFNQGYAVFTINVINDNDNAPYFVPYNVSLSLLEQLGYSNFLTLQVSLL